MQIDDSTDYAPAALYAGVSASRQDVALSVTARLLGYGWRNDRMVPGSTRTEPRAGVA